MNNERFAIPEMLFHPSDVGIHEMGVAEAIVHSINNTPQGQILLSDSNSLVSSVQRQML